MSKAGEKILEGLEEAVLIAKGEKAPARMYVPKFRHELEEENNRLRAALQKIKDSTSNRLTDESDFVCDVATKALERI